MDISIHNFGGVLMEWFPDRGNVIGAQGTLIRQDSYIPSKEGALVYFICEDVQNELNRVEAAGGKIYQPKTQISQEHGFYGCYYRF